MFQFIPLHPEIAQLISKYVTHGGVALKLKDFIHIKPSKQLYH